MLRFGGGLGSGNGCYWIDGPMFGNDDGSGVGNGFVFHYAFNSTSGISYGDGEGRGTDLGDGEGCGTGFGTGKGSHRDAKGQRPDERWRKLC